MLAAGAAHHHQPVVGVLALQPHQMVLVSGHPGDQAPGSGAAATRARSSAEGISAARGHQLEVDRAVGVGADQPAIAPVLQVVAHAFAPRLGENRRGGGIGGGDQPLLAGLLVLDADDDVAVVGRASRRPGTCPRQAPRRPARPRRRAPGGGRPWPAGRSRRARSRTATANPARRRSRRMRSPVRSARISPVARSWTRIR